MKKIIGSGVVPAVVCVLIIIVTYLILTKVPGCYQVTKHLKSFAVGLDRTITLYANDGSEIRSWEGDIQVEVKGSSARFIVDNKATHISGTFVIEEK